MKKLIFGFSTIIVLIITLGLYSLQSMKTLSMETTNLYEHPYKVSNAVKEIKINLISIHRYMKDVVLAENEQELNSAIEKVSIHEKQAIAQFDVIFEKYLGNKQEIHALYSELINWKQIRQKVIQLTLAGKHKEAAKITKFEGAEHVKKLTVATDKLLAFAEDKANGFYLLSETNASHAYTILSVLLIIMTLFSSAIALMVILSSKRAERKIKKQLHLIDQNIMMATLNLDGEIEEITNKFARYIHIEKSHLLGQSAHFFLGDDTSRFDEIMNTIKSGKVWEGEIQRVTKGHAPQHFYSSIIPAYNAELKIISFTNIIHDISDKKALEVLSITDKLTGLFNRRHFDTMLAKELAITRRKNSYLALVIIDIDYFKKYNDTYGHPAGDKVLTLISKTLSNFMKRPNDYLFRLGGEEFGIIFNVENRKNSMQFLQTLKKEIETLKIPHCQNEVSDFVTISLGAKFIKGDEITSEESLYQEADEALYKAKEKRNTLVVTEPIMIESALPYPDKIA